MKDAQTDLLEMRRKWKIVETKKYVLRRKKKPRVLRIVLAGNYLWQSSRN